ncbi:hypothetical protein Pen02_03460 [Plantactinospora endophytica]|uniref:Uncharacterized protein n=1 Tax=Plantactinospora endophytica TaxID=673535 RepID=A0ABQ4DSJ3_9ACTN|nr:hypothetical protein Pen02_03460 [Plantactinospora endophytica]
MTSAAVDCAPNGVVMRLSLMSCLFPDDGPSIELPGGGPDFPVEQARLRGGGPDFAVGGPAIEAEVALR